ncbi:MAG: hypothetical protein K8H88_10065 [Sandaracinaceae bacterium]|nr:hypothetical protein [Sandaracinaceae bacterium]
MRKQLLLVGLVALGAVALSGCKIVVDDTYTFCRNTSDCDAGDICALVSVPAASTSGNFCTYGCSSDASCESGRFGRAGACYSLGFGETPQICFQTCFDNSDCYSSSVCVEVTESTTGLMNRICLPNN